MNGIQREKLRAKLWTKTDELHERLPHLPWEDFAVIEQMFSEALEPLEELDRPMPEDVEEAKLRELKRGIDLLEQLKRGQRSGFVPVGTLTPLVVRTARRVERLARQLSRLSSVKPR